MSQFRDSQVSGSYERDADLLALLDGDVITLSVAAVGAALGATTGADDGR